MDEEYVLAKQATCVRVSATAEGELILGFEAGGDMEWFQLNKELTEGIIRGIWLYVQDQERDDKAYPRRKALKVNLDETSNGEPAIHLATEDGCSGWIGLSWPIADGMMDVLKKMRMRASN